MRVAMSPCSSSLYRRREARAQPFFQNHEAEEDLVMIAGARAMLVEERPDRSGLQIIEDVRLRITQHVFHFPGLRGTEPFVDDIHGEAALLAPENRGRQKSFADFAVQPLTPAIPYFEV